MNALISETLASFLPQLQAAKRVYVAFSGGVDSQVLLHALGVDLALPVAAIHINHGLSTQAPLFEAHCRQQCQQLNIACHVLRVSVKQGGDGVEAAARKARYHAIKQFIAKDELVLMAHHQDDQALTFLIQLMRGSGVKGLASMPVLRQFGPGQLLRPLLTVTRQQIEHYADHKQLTWVEDNSNQDQQLTRNFLQTQVLPLLIERNPAATACLARSAEHCANATQLINELASEDWQRVNGVDENTINIEALENLSTQRQAHAVRFGLSQLGLNLPSTKQLMLLLKELFQTKIDARPLWQWPGVEVRRFHQQLYLLPQATAMSLAAYYRWQIEQDLTLPHGRLRSEQVLGKGLHCDSLQQVKKLEIRFRRGGEAIRPYKKKHHQRLKTLFQVWQVPYWQRDHIPLLYCDDELVAVINYCIADAWHTNADELGWVVHFETQITK